MEKKKALDEIMRYLAQELADLLQGAERTGGELDDRAVQLRRQLLMYRFLPTREFTAQDVITPAGLVEVELNGIRSFYLIVPSGGGLVTRVSGEALQVITPQSPLGEALLGRKVGDSIEVAVRGQQRIYRIVGYT